MSVDRQNTVRNYMRLLLHLSTACRADGYAFDNYLSDCRDASLFETSGVASKATTPRSSLSIASTVI